jgi:hypothetical protein
VAADEEGPEQIDLDGAPELAHVDVVHRTVGVPGAAGVVVDNVDPAVRGAGRADHRLDAAFVGDVALDEAAFAARVADQLLGLPARLGRQFRHDDTGALGGEAQRGRAADARSGPGDDGDLSIQPHAISRSSSPVTSSGISPAGPARSPADAGR